MIKTIAEIDGMVCSMCEAHINETIRSYFTVKKVKASRRKGIVKITSEEPIDSMRLSEVITGIGYILKSVHSD